MERPEERENLRAVTVQARPNHNFLPRIVLFHATFAALSVQRPCGGDALLVCACGPIYSEATMCGLATSIGTFARLEALSLLPF